MIGVGPGLKPEQLSAEQQIVVRILSAALDTVAPARLLNGLIDCGREAVRLGAHTFPLKRGRVVLLGVGKASAAMAAALPSTLHRHIRDGLIVVKRGYGLPGPVTVMEAGHPLPDQAGLEAAGRVERLATEAGPSDLILLLLSGGASALLPAPAGELTLAEKQVTTDLLLRAGRPVAALNTVRKHLSRLKGGRLALLSRPAQAAVLALSDVAGDDLSTIGSGPMVADPTTYRDAIQVVKEAGVWLRTPQKVRLYLEEGARGRHPETPKPGDPALEGIPHLVIGNNEVARTAARQQAMTEGLATVVLGERIGGEAREAARRFVATAVALQRGEGTIAPPVCLIAGGETTVTVHGGGKGGPAQEFSLAAAIDLEGTTGLTVAALATDGTDGPTDAAGGIVDGTSARRAQQSGADPQTALEVNNAHPVLKRLGQLLVTGPTFTNVNDLYVALILPPG